MIEMACDMFDGKKETIQSGSRSGVADLQSRIEDSD